MKIDLGTKRERPNTISCSGVKTYNHCPLKFYYQYVLRLPSPPSEYFLRGNIIHNVFENFYKDFPKIKTNKPDNLIQAFKSRAKKLLDIEWGLIGIEHDDLFSHEPYQEQKEYDSHKKWVEFFGQQQAMKYYELYQKMGSHPQARRFFLPYYTEVPLYDYKLGINGRIDAVFQIPYTQKYYAVDYKTSTKMKNIIDGDEELQLCIYALLLKNCEGKKCTEGHIYLARIGGEPIIYFQKQQLKDTEKLCLETSKNYLDGRKELFKRKTNIFCRWCPFSPIECRDIVPKPKIYTPDYSHLL